MHSYYLVSLLQGKIQIVLVSRKQIYNLGLQWHDFIFLADQRGYVSDLFIQNEKKVEK